MRRPMSLRLGSSQVAMPRGHVSSSDEETLAQRMRQRKAARGQAEGSYRGLDEQQDGGMEG
jgi:hypothetical protein